MLSYETALKLKNAGYNQETEKNLEFTYYYLNKNRIGYVGKNHIFSNEDGELTKIPSLSELIEACVRFPRQFSLYGRDVNRWEATSVGELMPYGAHLSPSITEYGSTPEEAVANLLLELNKK